MTLRVDAETHGHFEDYENAWELFKVLIGELDEDVIEVSVKKRAVKDESPHMQNTL